MRDDKYNLVCGRAISVEKGLYTLITENGTVNAKLSGSFLYKNREKVNYPCIGDWIVFKNSENAETHTVYSVLKRKTCLKRKVKGNKTEQQLIAANVDLVFIVMGATYDFNLRKLERFMVQVKKSGATPIIVLNKIDLCDDYDEKIKEIEKLADDVTTIVTSTIDGRGVQVLREHICPGKTAIFFGSSGVGKSSLINSIQEEKVVLTKEIGIKTQKGRHTTTWRETVILPNGGILIDNPGIREVQLWSDDDDLNAFFSDIAELAVSCQYNDCTHTNEPGCMVLQSIESGSLDPERLENYRRMKREVINLNKRKKQKEKKSNSKKNDYRRNNRKIKPEKYI